MICATSSWSGTAIRASRVGQAAERIGDRPARVVFVDSEVPVDGGSFASTALEALIATNGDFWAPPTAAGYDGQGLTDEQIARIVGGSTPRPGATPTEPAVPEGTLGKLPATCITCLPDGPEPNGDVARLLSGERWRLVEMDTGHRPMFSRPLEPAEILHDAATAS